jgi:hypothetical protein
LVNNKIKINKKNNNVRFKHDIIYDTKGVAVTHRANFHQSNLPVPYPINIYKGNFAATLSRAFIEYIVRNESAQKMTEWLRKTDTADEHLWSTINYNALFNAPGGHPGLLLLTFQITT